MPLLRRLDRYVLRAFLGAYLQVLVAGVLVFVLVDLLGRAALLNREEASFLVAAGRHYAVQVPVFVYRSGPFLVLLGALFAVARLERGSETIAMMAAGIGAPRIIGPVLAAGGALAIAIGLSQELLLPHLAPFADAVRAGRSEARWGLALPMVPAATPDGGAVILHARSFDAENGVASGVWIRELDALYRERADWWVDRLTWDGSRWTARDGVIVGLQGEGVRPVGPEGEAAPLPLPPDALQDVGRDPLFLPIPALVARVRRAPENPEPRVEIWQRLLYPIATVVLLAMGLPFVLGRSERGALVWGLVACVGLAAAYFVFSFFLLDLGMEGRIPAPAAAILPPSFFLGVGLVLLGRVRT